MLSFKFETRFYLIVNIYKIWGNFHGLEVNGPMMNRRIFKQAKNAFDFKTFFFSANLGRSL